MMNALVILGLVLLSAPLDQADLSGKVAALTAAELAGRGAATAGEREAANLVATWLADAGCAPAFGDGWFQDVPLTDGRVAVNVAGVLPGAGGLADRWLIVGAHIDHLGRVDPTAAGVPAAGEFYPGAGDNASGVVAVVAAVTAIVGDPAVSRRSLLVCGFGAEEIGLLGSAHLAAHLPVPATEVDAMVNLDAVGRLGSGPLNVAGLETSDRFTPLVEAAAGRVVVRAQDTSLLQSDHLNFLALAIPSLFLFTGGYAEMNSPADDLATLDLGGVLQVADITRRLLVGLLTDPGPFGFTPPPPAASPDPATGNRETWFGSVPQFGGDAAAGYGIAAVSDGGPAARAGLKAGDVLVELGGLEVLDLPTFTSALRLHDPGDVVEVVVRRDGERRRFYVTLGDRAERGR